MNSGSMRSSILHAKIAIDGLIGCVKKVSIGKKKRRSKKRPTTRFCIFGNMKSNVEATAASLSLAPVQQSNRLQLEKYPSAASIKTGSGTAEERYWKSYRFPVLLKQSGAVTRCEFSPVAPFTIVATAGPGVALINPVTKEVNRSVSKFKTLAYSASYRSDGNLFVAGGMDPVVQVFDSHNPRTILRSFRGHKAAVQVARFSRELPQVLSGSDDKTLCLWDVEA